MKVVHLVTEDMGGAGRAARRISHALCRLGVSSEVLVLDRFSADEGVSEVWQNRFQKVLFKVKRKLYRARINRKASELKFYEASFGLNALQLKKVAEADIVHLHWVGLSYLSYRTLRLLANKKTVVWTLHDMWPFTAGCFYDTECGNYRAGCANCPQVRDTAYVERVADLKRSAYERSFVTFVGCSRWISDCARKSAILSPAQRAAVTTVPNPIDTEVFYAEDKKNAREKLKLPQDKKLVLFGAMSSDSDPRKGYPLLLEALRLLDAQDYAAVIFGNGAEFRAAELPVPCYALGRIADDAVLRAVYSAADVFCAPSVQENLSNSVMESLACGTPVVAFGIGGMADLIDDGKDGFLAPAFDTAAYAEGIRKACALSGGAEYAVASVAERFAEDTVARRYLAVYEEAQKRGTGEFHG